MPWKDDGPMERRVELIREWKQGESIRALAEAYGVARKTVYKWIERHASEGTAGLADRSRAPHTSPQGLSAAMIASVIAARQRWGWGSRKLLVKLAAEWGEQKVPSASTIAEVLRRKDGARPANAECARRPMDSPSPTPPRPIKPGARTSRASSKLAMERAAMRSRSALRTAASCCAARSRPRPTPRMWKGYWTTYFANMECPK